MPTIEQETQLKKDLGILLDDIYKVNPESLIRTDVLGKDLDFSAGLPYFERILNLFSYLKDISLDTISYNKLNSIKAHATNLLKDLKEIQEFSIQKYPSNAVGERDSRINRIRESYDAYFDNLAFVISFATRRGTDFKKLEGEAKESIEILRKLYSEQANHANKQKKEMDSILEQVRTAAKEIGVTQHAIHFKDEADGHDRWSKWWLIALGILSASTILFAIWNINYYMNYQGQLSNMQALQVGIAKILIFSILYFAIVWIGRVYKAHRHNYVTNKHRQNALSTFETFVKASSDEQTKDAVLIQAAQAIFTQQPSGYITNDNDGPTTPQILEIIRNTIPRK